MSTQAKLVGAHEIEERFGLNRMQVHRLMQAGDFPEPAAELKGGRVWNEEDVAERIAKLRAVGRINKQGFVVPWRFLDDGNRAEEDE